MTQPARGPLRTLFSFLGLSELSDGGSRTISGEVQPVTPPDWQQARVAAHRGVSAAGQGDFNAADSYFTTAFTLDRTLQPGQIANFWTMSLTGLETAERALRGVGRYDDAARLASEVAFRHASHPARQPSQAAS
jgi:hypothetical protein